MDEFKIGIGIDYHRLVENRKLILGGVEIPHHLGLDGHSDADVVLHALSDAILGALALGDIGEHFPNTDLQHKNIDSILILSFANDKAKEKGFVIGNVDIMILLEAPKLKPYIEDMRNKIAACLQINKDCISIKATTTEGLDSVGRKEGSTAHAVVLLKRK